MKKMKKQRMLLALLLAVVLCAGCANAPAQDGWTWRFARIDLPVALAEKQRVDCCFQEGDTSIFAVRDRRPDSEGSMASEAPNYGVQYFCVMENFEVKGIYDINKPDETLDSVVPYQDGILYVDYAVKKGAHQAFMVDWTIQWVTPEETVAIAQGEAVGRQDVPALFLLDGVPHYLWKAWDGSGGFGVSRIEGTETVTVFEEKAYSIAWQTNVICNGKQYAFAAGRDGKNDDSIFIGDAAGILYTVTPGASFYGLTDSDLVYLDDAENQQDSGYTLVHMSLKDGKTASFPIDYPVFRICGSGDRCIAMDKDGHMVVIDLAKEEVVQILRPVEVGDNTGDTYAMGDGRYLVEFERMDIRTRERTFFHYVLTIS